MVTYFKIGMFQHIIGSHPVQDELGLVGHPDNVVLHGVREQPSLVDQLNESQPGVLLQAVLPLLRAQQHHQLNHGVGVLERRQTFAFHQQLLAVRSYQRFGEEGCEVYHDFPQ